MRSLWATSRVDAEWVHPLFENIPQTTFHFYFVLFYPLMQKEVYWATCPRGTDSQIISFQMSCTRLLWPKQKDSTPNVETITLWMVICSHSSEMLARSKGLTINIDFWFCHILMVDLLITPSSNGTVLQTRVFSWLGHTICLHTAFYSTLGTMYHMGFSPVVLQQKVFHRPGPSWSVSIWSV